MGKQRNYKAEIWTNDQFVECSIPARLMFFGLMSFCDDRGVHKASIRRLLMEVFPSDRGIDEAHGQRLMDELIEEDLVGEFEHEGRAYWYVKGWREHQALRKYFFRHPPPPWWTPADLPKWKGGWSSSWKGDQQYVDESHGSAPSEDREKPESSLKTGTAADEGGERATQTNRKHDRGETGENTGRTPGETQEPRKRIRDRNTPPSPSGMSPPTGGDGPPQGSKRGTRWERQNMPPAFLDFAVDHQGEQGATLLDPLEVFEGFQDFWAAKTGRDATKTDWLATWRNWFRKEYRDEKRRASGPGGSSRPSSVDQTIEDTRRWAESRRGAGGAH